MILLLITKRVNKLKNSIDTKEVNVKGVNIKRENRRKSLVE